MNKDNGLCAGYARECITPDYTVCLAGYGDDEIRRSQTVVDDIYLTCIAVSSGGDTVLLYTADQLSFDLSAAQEVRTAVTEATGIPGERIFCTATHSHSSPLLYGDQPDAVRFRKSFVTAAVAVAKAALADLAGAEMYKTVRELERMNFIRHYVMADGTYAGSNFGNWNQPIVGHAAETDPRMLLLQFRREGKPDILLMNWQAHNDNVRDVGYYGISASYVGRIRARLEAKTGMEFAFFMGASGNQNPSSRIESENHGLDFIAYGERMADYAIEAIPSMKPVSGTGIRTKRVMFAYDVDHSWDHRLEEANEVFRVWKSEGRKEGDELARKYGFSSSFQARDIRTRAALPLTGTLELNAFRIGDIGFITSTNELFSTVGIHVRAHSPFETTFILTGNMRYLPCARAYEYRSYEADTSLFAKGTAEKVADAFVCMLKDIF